MAKKKTNKKSKLPKKDSNSRNLIILLVISIVIITMLSLKLLGAKNTPNTTPTRQQPTEKIYPTYIPEKVSPTPHIIPDENLSYEVPQGWKKTVNEYGGIKLTSPEYQLDKNEMYVVNGLSIHITGVSADDPEGYIDRIFSDPLPYDINKKNFTIAGKKAMSFNEDYEGHRLFIYIAVKNIVWVITVQSKDMPSEISYQNVIDSFINSLKFKN